MFKSKLQERITEKKITSKEIVKQLKYVNITIATDRVDRIINSPMLTFGNGEYDYRFVTFEVVEAICRVLDIKESVYKTGIKEIKNELTRIENRYKANIKIFSEKEPQSLNWIGKMMISRSQSIKLEDDLVDKSLNKQKEIALDICKSHFEEKNGSLGTQFGDIKFYRYFYSDLDFIDFNIEHVKNKKSKNNFHS